MKKGKTFTSTYVTNKFSVKICEVHLVASGPIVLCKAKFEDGTEQCFSWNSKANRDLIKSSASDKIFIQEDPTVPKGKGWDYNEY